MFEEKATLNDVNEWGEALANKINEFDEKMLSFAELMGTQHRVFDARMGRYARRLSLIMADIDLLFKGINQLETVVNANARAGVQGNAAITDLRVKLKGVCDALDILAAEDGKKFETLPEIPAVVTVQPGLPARIGLTKNGKPTKKASLPAPVTLSTDEMGRGLALIR